MSVIITGVTLSKNPVETNESFSISVSVKETISEPASYRLAFRLGQPAGAIESGGAVQQSG